MDQGRAPPGRVRHGFPRTRGDGPVSTAVTTPAPWVSPHTRGWTLCSPSPSCTVSGFPAHAGMDPPRPTPGRPAPRFPRTRGDGPPSRSNNARSSAVSPHTRGWTRWRHVTTTRRRGFPAHAGMDRTGGAGPVGRRGFPRTRGDGPSAASALAARMRVSPHTRGWTRSVQRLEAVQRGFPAHAGMDHAHAGGHLPGAGFPRTRGDGPRFAIIWDGIVTVSPHTRGWTVSPRHLGPHRIGFPAHAGMDPSASASHAGR